MRMAAAEARETVAENEPNHAAAQRAQRHADSDLGDAARYGVRHGGVEAYKVPAGISERSSIARLYNSLPTEQVG